MFKTEEALAIIGGQVDEELLLRNEYLAIENEILRKKIEGRIKLSQCERMRLATIGKKIGIKALRDVAMIVKPETILTWYRKLIAAKFDSSKKREKKVGRPLTDCELEALILQISKRNPRWGYDRIAGALSNLGDHISDQTVGNILKRNGIMPAPGRKPKLSWSERLWFAENPTYCWSWTSDHIVIRIIFPVAESNGCGCLVNRGGYIDDIKPHAALFCTDAVVVP